jgi:hypothetical protein
MTKERATFVWRVVSDGKVFFIILGPATRLHITTTLSFVIPRVCNFIGFEKKLVLKTKGLGASKVGKSQ